MNSNVILSNNWFPRVRTLKRRENPRLVIRFLSSEEPGRFLYYVFVFVTKPKVEFGDQPKSS